VREILSVEAMTARELLASYSKILGELRRRGILRSGNAPAGDLAEILVATAYGGELPGASEKSWDVRASDGRRLQVKARVAQPPGGSHFSVVRSWDFDAAVFVMFDPHDYSVANATEVEVEHVRAKSTYSEHTNGWRLTVSTLLKVGGLDVTKRLRNAFDEVDSFRSPNIE